jgi:hypothetical protein
MSTTQDQNLPQLFAKNGYVLIRNFFSVDEIKHLIEEIKNTAGQNKKSDILDVGNLKFHHLIMHRNEKLREFISQPKVVDFLKQFMGPNIWVRWDQAVEKSPGAGTFPWHQDNSYSQLKDAHFQFWISLTKMTKENGGIWLVPGSHHKILKHDIEGPHTIFRGETESPEFIAAEIGDIVLFSSQMLHSTTPNITDHSRWAYVVEYMKAEHIDPYIESPYLMIAENGQPAMRYVYELPAENSWTNRIKYFREKRRIASKKVA